MPNFTWSYSSLGLFQQCPRKYYRLRVAKDIVEPETEHLLYGKMVHEAAEKYIRDGEPVPEKFSSITPVLDVLKGIPGHKHCEYKMGLTEQLEPCGFFDKDVWWRGIGDLVIVNGTLAFSIDYKTSKNAKYADMKQLDVLAAALFTHFPQVEKIKSGLVFVISGEFVHKEHTRELRDSYFASFDEGLDRLAAAQETGVWNANTGPLCRFCPVVSCEHNRKR